MLLLPELVETIAENHEPHHLPHYALELATAFHDFYEKCRVLDDAAPDTDAGAPAAGRGGEDRAGRARWR